uniref:schwannomin-interacting protein 1-like n=1 Tax=Pristiophorus japonicus TaxID=55135 RepID=UPI00398E4B50
MDGAQRLTSWERTENNSWPTMGATFSCTSRFHSRMNLQLCFINDSSSESESDDPAQGVSATPSPQEAPDEVPSAEGDLHSRQKELECEAKRGLAMVKRQIDLEKQKQRTQAASDWSGEAQWRGRGLEPSVLHEMTLVQLQSLQANVFSQIHRLNTQLMELLESRDDLQTEQDAMLVEIGDLTH